MKLYVNNPYDFNTVSLKKNAKVEYTPTQEAVVSDHLSNFVGKYFGINSPASWQKYYDVVNEVVVWAKAKAKSSEIPEVMQVVRNLLEKTPTLNENRILDFRLQMNLEDMPQPKTDHNGNKEEEKEPIKTETKEEVKHDNN
jgi:hypothetical protein